MNRKHKNKPHLDTLSNILKNKIPLDHTNDSVKSVQYQSGNSYVVDFKDNLKHGKGLYITAILFLAFFLLANQFLKLFL